MEFKEITKDTLLYNGMNIYRKDGTKGVVFDSSDNGNIGVVFSFKYKIKNEQNVYNEHLIDETYRYNVYDKYKKLYYYE